MEQGTTDGSAPKQHRGRGRTPRLQVEVGQRFGRGVIIDADVPIPIKSRPGKAHRGARLICDCGTEYDGTLQAILSGHVRSCGCLRQKHFVDHTGQRFGKFVVVQFVGTRPRKTGTSRFMLWLCRCDCGNERLVESTRLNGGRVMSCGCARRRPRTPNAARNSVLKTYKGAAKSRNLSWDLADEDFDRLIVQDCYYCGSPPSAVTRSGRYGAELVHGGLDRKDNALGYFLGNVVSCCRTCNVAKNNLTYDDFMAWITRLIAHHWFNPELTPSRRLKSAI